MNKNIKTIKEAKNITELILIWEQFVENKKQYSLIELIEILSATIKKAEQYKEKSTLKDNFIFILSCRYINLKDNF
jgi:hypothetical protein